MLRTTRSQPASAAASPVPSRPGSSRAPSNAPSLAPSSRSASQASSIKSDLAPMTRKLRLPWPVDADLANTDDNLAVFGLYPDDPYSRGIKRICTRCYFGWNYIHMVDKEPAHVDIPDYVCTSDSKGGKKCVQCSNGGFSCSLDPNDEPKSLVRFTFWRNTNGPPSFWRLHHGDVTSPFSDLPAYYPTTACTRCTQRNRNIEAKHHKVCYSQFGRPCYECIEENAEKVSGKKKECSLVANYDADAFARRDMKGVPGFEQALARYLEIKAQGKNEKPVASSSKLIASSSKTIAGSSKLAPAKKRTPSAIKTETDTVALDSSDALPKSAKRKRSEKKPKSKELVEDSDDSTNDMVVDDSNIPRASDSKTESSRPKPKKLSKSKKVKGEPEQLQDVGEEWSQLADTDMDLDDVNRADSETEPTTQTSKDTRSAKKLEKGKGVAKKVDRGKGVTKDLKGKGSRKQKAKVAPLEEDDMEVDDENLIVAESEEYVENQFGDPDSSVEASLFDTCVAMHHDVLSRLRAIINTETVSALMSIELECVEKEMLPPRMHLGRSMERWNKDIERYEKYWAKIKPLPEDGNANVEAAGPKVVGEERDAGTAEEAVEEDTKEDDEEDEDAEESDNAALVTKE